MGKHLFIAPLSFSFGEATHGVRLAAELRAAGHEILFLAPKALEGVVTAARLRFGRIDLVMRGLDQILFQVLREERCDSLVLVDAAAVAGVFESEHLRLDVLERPPVPIVALDLWNLPEADPLVDVGPMLRPMSALAAGLPRRLVPVPFVRPSARGAYCALPSLTPLTDSERRDIRAGVGAAGEDAKVILFPTARWQNAPDSYPLSRAVAAAVPSLLGRYVERLDPRVRVVQIGPWQMESLAPLGERHVRLPGLPHGEYLRLLQASDLLLSLNMSSSTVAAAVAARVPVLMMVSAARGRDPAAIEAALGLPLGPLAREWLAGAPPLYPFRVWPIGMHAFLAAVLRDNPYLETMRTVELLDEAGFARAGQELLFDAAEAEAARARGDAYATSVSALPGGAAVFESLLLTDNR